MPNWTPQRLPVSTCVFRTPKQLPNATQLLVICAPVAGWRRYAKLEYIDRENENENESESEHGNENENEKSMINY